MSEYGGSKLLHEQESYEIRGACFAVWKEFGGSFKENVVEKSLAKEFKLRHLSFERQKRIEIFYKGEKVGTYVPDFIVENKIVIELKVKPLITAEDRKQFWRYLKGSNCNLGFLINFGTKKLEIVRRIYDKARLMSD